VIAFSRHDGQPVKVTTFMDIDEESLECFYVEGMELPDGDILDESKTADGDGESKEEGNNQEEKDEHASFPSGLDGNLRPFEVDDGSSLETPATGLNQTGIHSNLVLNAAQKRWFSNFWNDDSNEIKFQVANPKKPNTDTWRRYEQHKNAKNVGEMKRATGTKADLIYAFCRKQCVFSGINSVQLIRDQPLLRALLVSSPSTVAARTIAETMNTDSSLNEILMAKVNRVQHAESFIEVWMEEAKGIGDNRNEEKIKVYNNTNWEYEVEETKEGSKMLITDQALPEDKATSEKISSSDESKDPFLKELIESLELGRLKNSCKTWNK